ncbi:MAG TPA: TonB family protein [Caulobacteraceae bacterium]|jgi:TonB family protein|nr:TonB family protein [Caulobacteraceae bacterium]
MAAVTTSVAAVPPHLISQPPAAEASPPPGFKLSPEAASDYTVTISASGQVIGCRLIGPSGYPSFDKQGCAAVQAAAFSPAADSQARPVAAMFDAQVRWPQGEIDLSADRPDAELGIAAVPAGAPAMPVTRLAVTYDHGAVRDCAVTQSSGSPALDATACSTGVGALDPPAGAEAGVLVRQAKIRFIAPPPFGATPRADVNTLYPERASRLGIGGYAVLTCGVAAEGSVDHRVVADEQPGGQQFGLAALKFISRNHTSMQAGHAGEVAIPFWFGPGGRSAAAPEGWVRIVVGPTPRR